MVSLRFFCLEFSYGIYLSGLFKKKKKTMKLVHCGHKNNFQLATFFKSKYKKVEYIILCTKCMSK